MTARSKKFYGTSPVMFLASVLLHTMFFIAIFFFSLNSLHRTTPDEPILNRVKLVEAPSEPSSIGKIDPDHLVAETPKDFASEIRDIPPQPDSDPKREVVESSRSSISFSDSLKFAKRKRPLERVEIAKPVEKEVKETKKAESAEKRQDSQALLEAKLAAIKKELESRKKNAAKPQVASSSSESSGNSEAGNMDPELLRWLESVKTRINANWSLFGEHQIDKSTLISIQVAHDGRLQNASIERGSGDDNFDKSAMRAVMQAAPFPPIPAGFGDRIKKAGGLALRFTPRGMQ